MKVSKNVFSLFQVIIAFWSIKTKNSLFKRKQDVFVNTQLPPIMANSKGQGHRVKIVGTHGAVL